MSEALDGFLDKWRRRWPEWALVEGFVPPSQRRPAQAWFALLQELEDIMNVAGDALPADAKLAWWQQELRDWEGRRSRHPLGRVLEPFPAPWAALAEAAPAIQTLRDAPASLESAMAGLEGFARAVAAVEAVLFARSAPVDVRALAVQWLEARAQVAGAAAPPAGIELGAWRQALLQAWPGKPALARPHRIWSRLARRRLARHLAGKPLPGPALQQLWDGWRAASGAD